MSEQVALTQLALAEFADILDNQISAVHQLIQLRRFLKCLT